MNALRGFAILLTVLLSPIADAWEMTGDLDRAVRSGQFRQIISVLVAHRVP